jgi:hypothetical protein
MSGWLWMAFSAVTLEIAYLGESPVKKTFRGFFVPLPLLITLPPVPVDYLNHSPSYGPITEKSLVYRVSRRIFNRLSI